MNYANLAFTDAVKALQAQNGSRHSYERMEKQAGTDGLTDAEIAFIQERDSFYMATYGENGYPYIQHRGGPAGFIKIMDPQTMGIVDFTGNKQYISVGNIATHPQVAMIFVSYPQKARLKIYADARIVEIADNPALFERLDPVGYKHRPERMMLFEVKAYDWNCPQHLTPRYTLTEIEAAFASQGEYIAQLETENKRLKALIA